MGRGAEDLWWNTACSVGCRKGAVCVALGERRRIWMERLKTLHEEAETERGAGRARRDPFQPRSCWAPRSSVVRACLASIAGLISRKTLIQAADAAKSNERTPPHPPPPGVFQAAVTHRPHEP